MMLLAHRARGIRRLRPRSQRKSASALSSVHCSLPLAEAGACQLLPSSLARRRKSVSARSLVQDSSAPAWLSTAAARFADARGIG